MTKQGVSQASLVGRITRVALAALLSVGTFFWMFILGEGISLPDTVPIAVRVFLLAVGYLGVFLLCQFLLSLGHTDARRDWPVMLALNWCPLALAVVVLRQEIRQGLALVGVACVSLAISYLGAALATYLTRRRLGGAVMAASEPSARAAPPAEEIG